MSKAMDVFWHDDVLRHDTGFGVFEAPPSDLLDHQTQGREGRGDNWDGMTGTAGIHRLNELHAVG